MRSKFFVLTSLVVSTMAMAHPGHDHSSISNPMLHSLMTVAFVACGGLAVYFYKRKQNKNDK